LPFAASLFYDADDLAAVAVHDHLPLADDGIAIFVITRNRIDGDRLGKGFAYDNRAIISDGRMSRQGRTDDGANRTTNRGSDRSTDDGSGRCAANGSPGGTTRILRKRYSAGHGDERDDRAQGQVFHEGTPIVRKREFAKREREAGIGVPDEAFSPDFKTILPKGRLLLCE
jgi:hypothetical protein